MRRYLFAAIVLAGLAGLACIEVAALVSPDGPIFGNDNVNSNGNENASTNGNDNVSTNGNDNTGTNGNDNAGTNGNDNTSANDNAGNDNSSANDNTSANDNSSGNDNTSSNDNSSSGIPPLPAGATLTTTASGLQYYDYRLGRGNPPGLDDAVIVNYQGYLPDGTLFDHGQETRFPVRNVIDGFAEGLMGMTEGGKRRLVIPPDIGYGPDGNPGAGIKGTDTITFDVELVNIQFRTSP